MKCINFYKCVFLLVFFLLKMIIDDESHISLYKLYTNSIPKWNTTRDKLSGLSKGCHPRDCEVKLCKVQLVDSLINSVVYPRHGISTKSTKEYFLLLEHHDHGVP